MHDRKIYCICIYWLSENLKLISLASNKTFYVVDFWKGRIVFHPCTCLIILNHFLSLNLILLYLHLSMSFWYHKHKIVLEKLRRSKSYHLANDYHLICLLIGLIHMFYIILQINRCQLYRDQPSVRRCSWKC